MSEEDRIADNVRVYEKTRDQLNKTASSDSGLFDRSLLTLSSGFLAISLAFIKDIVSLGAVSNIWLLYGSWIGFALTIICTMAGFIHSQWSMPKLIKTLDGCFRQRKPDYEPYDAQYNKTSRRARWMNTISGGSFIFAVVLTIGFVIINTSKEVSVEIEEKKVQETVIKKAPETVK